jgi:hypothetical protein
MGRHAMNREAAGHHKSSRHPARGRRLSSVGFAAFLLAVLLPGAAGGQEDGITLPVTVAAAGDSVTVSVPATNPWTDTGIDLDEGSLDITADGLIKIAGSDPGKTPDGDQNCVASSGWTAPGLHCWALIARVGDGTPFEVGTSGKFQIETFGVLFLGVNDEVGAFGDNSGSWVAEVISGPPPPQGRYVALGDSYSSGEGATDETGDAAFDQATNTKGNRCHRSHHAYPEIIKTNLGMSDESFVFHACSGAIMADFFQRWGLVGQWTDAPQLDAIEEAGALSLTTRLVTLSLGGNDSGFAQAVDNCINGFLHWRDEELCLQAANTFAALGGALISNGGTILVHPSRDPVPGTTWDFCDNKCVKKYPTKSLTVPSLAGLLQQIHTRAPNAKIRFLLYPRLFPTKADADTCLVGLPDYKVTGKVTSRLNELGDSLNEVIRSQVDAVQEAGVDIEPVDPNEEELEGHRLCDSKEPWINGVIASPDKWTKVFTFHPKAVGQRYFAEIIVLSL